MKRLYAIVLLASGIPAAHGQMECIDRYLTDPLTYTNIVTSSDQVDMPRDLDFKPNTNELWVMLKGGTNGGSVYSWRDSVRLDSGAGLAWRYPNYEESFAHEINYFVQHCILGGQQPLSTIRDAAMAQELVEAAELSIATGKVVML